MLSILLLWWFVFPNCYGIIFKCSDDIDNWTVSINDQAELDSFMKQATSPIDNNTSRCIQLSLAGDISYRLNIVEMMQIQLGSAGGFIIMGVNGAVEIDCVGTDVSRDILKPISNTSLVIFGGLKFVKCPVPILIEEVSAILVENCDFM